MTSEIEETMKRLTSHQGVQSIVIMNNEGVPIRTVPAMESKDSVLYPALLLPLIDQARGIIKSLDPTNDYQNMRIRSKKNEILIYPEKDYSLVVVQAA